MISMRGIRTLSRRKPDLISGLDFQLPLWAWSLQRDRGPRFVAYCRQNRGGWYTLSPLCTTGCGASWPTPAPPRLVRRVPLAARAGETAVPGDSAYQATAPTPVEISAKGGTIRRLSLRASTGTGSNPAFFRFRFTVRRMFKNCRRTGAYSSNGIRWNSAASFSTERCVARSRKYALSVR